MIINDNIVIPNDSVEKPFKKSHISLTLMRVGISQRNRAPAPLRNSLKEELLKKMKKFIS